MMLQAPVKLPKVLHTVRRRKVVPSEWRESTSLFGNGIPTYDASNDDNCPYTVTLKYINSQKKREKRDKKRQGIKEKQRRQVEQSSGLALKGDKKSNGKKKIKDVVNITFQLYNEENGQETKKNNGACLEMDIIRNVLLREHQLEILRQATILFRGKIGSDVGPEREQMVKNLAIMISKLRLVSVHIIEYIYTWRQTIVRCLKRKQYCFKNTFRVVLVLFHGKERITC